MRENTTFTPTILDWFRINGRELPWRETHAPYAVWLSEIILQQTQVKQGMAYWERFMKRWPTVEALAQATEDEVLREWQGLGYYSRARNLHQAAQQVAALGRFPDTLEGIRQLKGVGDYTAAAIGSIAFGLPAAVVDGNVYRVLSRYFGIETPINTTEGKKTFQTLAQELLPTSEASAFNQAMMDFGATQCMPRGARCEECPLAESCEALRSGRVEQLPVKRKTLKVKERHLIYIYIRCKGHTAIHRRGKGDIWEGLWEPLLVSAPVAQARLIAKGIRHVLTHRVLMADFYLWETDERPTLPDDYIWIKEEDIDNYGIPRLVDKLLSKISYSDCVFGQLTR
jgi:A/G-specific adenine glycosylase